MDINIDQSVPRNDMTKDNKGKYIYNTSKSKKGIDKFNRDFGQYIEQRKAEMQKKMDEKLAKLNRPVVETPIYSKSIGEILIKTKDTIFDIVDDIMQFKFTGLLTKDDRLFCVGVLLLFMTVAMFIIYTFSTGNEKVDKKDIRINLALEGINNIKDIIK